MYAIYVRKKVYDIIQDNEDACYKKHLKNWRTSICQLRDGDSFMCTLLQ